MKILVDAFYILTLPNNLASYERNLLRKSLKIVKTPTQMGKMKPVKSKTKDDLTRKEEDDLLGRSEERMRNERR